MKSWQIYSKHVEINMKSWQIYSKHVEINMKSWQIYSKHVEINMKFWPNLYLTKTIKNWFSGFHVLTLVPLYFSWRNKKLL